MKKYTSDEVIELHEEYMQMYRKYWPLDAPTLCQSFSDWLKDKEQSSIPVKGQMIWVKMINDTQWYKRQFSHLDKEFGVFCEREYTEGVPMYWDEYSLTNPNE